MYKVCLLSLLVLVLSVTPLFAQEPSQPYRIELELDIYKTNAELITAPDSSLLLFTKTDGSWTSPPTFEFTRYNYQLKPTWKQKVELPPLSRYMTHYTDLPHTYIAIQGKDQHDFQFLKFHLQTGQLTKHAFRIESIDSVYVFKVLDNNYFLVSRSDKDGTPILLHLNEKTGETRPLPAVYGSESTFSDILVHQPEKQVSVVMSESNGRMSRLQTKLFDTQGNLIDNYFILPQPDKRPLVAEITPGDTSTRLLLGTYASRSQRYAAGFFSMPMAEGTDNARYYSFQDLKNFFKYLKPNREERLRKREADRIASGKESGLQYRVLLHDVYPTANGYILSGEVYFSESGGGNFGRIYSTTGTSGTKKLYHRTQAIALGFDYNGVLLWDNSFPLKEVQSSELRPTVEVVANRQGRVIIAHPVKGNEIYYQYMDQDNYIEEETKFEIQPAAEGAKITSISLSGILSWYGLNFVAYGWHNVKAPGSDSRTVFYINRVSF